jgi:polyphosphate kinase
MIKNKNRYVNRELSWLQFNARVLQEANDESVPLMERIRFVGIFSNNLDEFFRVRYATIQRIIQAGKEGTSHLGGIPAKELLEEITQVVIQQQSESLKILQKIQQQLKKHQVYIINEHQILPSQKKYVNEFFIQKVRPALMTIMLDDVKEFPLLRDSAAYLFVKINLKKNDTTFPDNHTYSLIELPRSIDRFVVLPSPGKRKYIILLDDLIRYNLGFHFNIFNYESFEAHMIKITRDAELDLETDLSKSFLEKLAASVKDRRTGDPVRFVYDSTMSQEMLNFLLSKMKIDETDSIIPGGKYHYRRDYMKFPTLDIKELMYQPQEPLGIPGLTLVGSVLEKIEKKDYLLYAPYQNFNYVVKFLRECALDPKVKTIKITIYRLAEISHIASSLINAKKNGKEVTVQIELQARFDEEANIRYAEQMQLEGIKVSFGVPGLKVHCKCCVIERMQDQKIVRYGFISTGNFNETTARIYTDYTLFTANQKILKEVNSVFDFFETNYKVKKFKHLIVSPHYTRKRIYKLIDNEIAHARQGKPSGIRIKINNLSNYEMIDKLYEASEAGVKIKLIVRGICCLIPGVKGMSSNIEAISIVDKYLEHPRLYIFENGGDPLYYISSADFMTRNLDSRVEIGCPIYDPEIKKELDETFEISWKDNVKARIISEKQDNAYRRNKQSKWRSQVEMYQYYKNKLEEYQNHHTPS